MRQVARLSTTTFFLSTVRYSAAAGREKVRRRSSLTMVWKGTLKCRPGSPTTRTTAPKRVTRPNSVTSTANRLATMAHASSMPATSSATARSRERLRAVAWGGVRSLKVRALLSPARRLQHPQVHLFHVARARADELLQAGQRLLDGLDLQTESGELGRAPEGAELEREVRRVALRVQDLLFLEGERLLDHRRRLRLGLVHRLHREDVGAVDGSQLVFLRAGDVAERVVHFIWRMHVQQLEGDHPDAGTRLVQLPLDRVFDLPLHRASVRGVNRIDAASRDHAAQRRQAQAAHEIVRLGDVEGVGDGIGHAVLDRPAQVDQVGVPREQERLFGLGFLLEPSAGGVEGLGHQAAAGGEALAAGRARGGRGALLPDEAELDALHPLPGDDAMRLERPRQA